MKINRRDTLKTLLVGSIGAGALGASGCKPSEQAEQVESSDDNGFYGRTEEEKLRDELLECQPSFFTDEEMTTLGVLIDIILPADEVSGSASDSGVLPFLDFIVKDIESHQTPLRSGLGWMYREGMQRFEKNFNDLNDQEMIAIIDDIAYPEETKPEHKPGEKFFSLLRNLTLTGFYTSEMGVKDLGYQGNVPNFWDGIPDEILQEQGLTYDEKYLPQYITREKSIQVAEWDEEGNLI